MSLTQENAGNLRGVESFNTRD